MVHRYHCRQLCSSHDDVHQTKYDLCHQRPATKVSIVPFNVKVSIVSDTAVAVEPLSILINKVKSNFSRSAINYRQSHLITELFELEKTSQLNVAKRKIFHSIYFIYSKAIAIDAHSFSVGINSSLF